MQKISGDLISSLINNVFLSGVIDECLLVIEKNVGTIQAIDMSNCFFVSCSEKFDTDLDDVEMGLSNLALLSKTFDSGDEVSFSIDEAKEQTWLKLKIKGKGNVKLILLDPETIPTIVEDAGAGEKLVDSYRNSLKLSDSAIEKISYFLDMFKPKDIVISIKKGKMYFSNGLGSTNQFKSSLGNIKAKDATFEIMAEHFLAVINRIKVLETDVNILVKADSPVILQTESAIWAFSPIPSV